MSFQFPSVFIPRVSGNHNGEYIENVFWAYFGGEECPVARVDLIMKEDARTGHIYQIGFVHFKPMLGTPSEEIATLEAKLESGESIKFMHAHPWYWVLRKNTSKPKSNRPRVLSEADEAEVKAAQKALLKRKHEYVSTGAEEGGEV